MPAKPIKTCPECGQRFSQGHHRQQFCTPAHGIAYNARIQSEGQAVMGLAKAWRASRNQKGQGEIREAGKEAFILLCRLLDESNTNDRLAGRTHPTTMYIRRQNANLLG